jgi:hypothetical protein
MNINNKQSYLSNDSESFCYSPNISQEFVIKLQLIQTLKRRLQILSLKRKNEFDNKKILLMAFQSIETLLRGLK